MFTKLRRLKRSAIQLLRSQRILDDIKFNQGCLLSSLQVPDGSVPLSKHEFKVFSQWGEDGIIQYLVNNLEVVDHTFIEFGVEDFSESNCRFLMMKDQWKGFVIDGSEKNINILKDSDLYWRYRLKAVASFVTCENISSVLGSSGFSRELGLLSIDIDGNDYHILQALQDWRPSILVVEYNDIFGWQRPVSVPYDPAFVRSDKHYSNQYWGANLPAFCYLANQRGYALVGTNSAGTNAFFVRRELLNSSVCEVTLHSCIREASFRDSKDKAGNFTFLSGASRALPISSMPLIDVRSREFLTVGDLNN